MKNYLIQFFYYTDLRADSVVAAQNELAALVLAMNKMKIEEWSVSKGFKVTISLDRE